MLLKLPLYLLGGARRQLLLRLLAFQLLLDVPLLLLLDGARRQQVLRLQASQLLLEGLPCTLPADMGRRTFSPSTTPLSVATLLGCGNNPVVRRT